MSASDRSAYANLTVAMNLQPAVVLYYTATAIAPAARRLLADDERTKELTYGVLDALDALDIDMTEHALDALDALRAHLDQIGDAPGLAAVALAREDLLGTSQRFASLGPPT